MGRLGKSFCERQNPDAYSFASGTYEGLVGFGEHLMKNPLIIGFFLLIIKVFWTFREKVPEIKGEFAASLIGF